MEQHDPVADLAYIRRVLAQTERRVDPHAAHFLIWGLLVLVSYPAMNALCLAGSFKTTAIVGACALAIGIVGSMVLGARLKANPRLEGQNTHVAAQVQWIVFANLVVALIVGSAGPGIGWIHPQSTPVVWGFAYANMAFMLGVVYRPEYRLAGGAILCATLAAMTWMRYSGFILGPAMGLGMIVPSWMAERRVALIARES